MNIARRMTKRVPLRSSSFHATWLSDWRKVNETGVLTDISTGGFAGCMAQAPARGHLLHARLSVEAVAGSETSPAIEVDARICGRVPDGSENTWIVHCAIESIRPVDEKLMIQTIEMHESGNSPRQVRTN